MGYKPRPSRVALIDHFLKLHPQGDGVFYILKIAKRETLVETLHVTSLHSLTEQYWGYISQTGLCFPHFSRFSKQIQILLSQTPVCFLISVYRVFILLFEKIVLRYPFKGKVSFRRGF